MSNVTTEGRDGSYIRFTDAFPMGNCKINRASYCYVGNKMLEASIAYTHNGCGCNEYLALKHRHQMQTLAFTMDPDIMLQHLNTLIGESRLQAQSFTLLSRHEVVNSYVGRWKRRYLRAMLSLEEYPLCNADFNINMFVKPDKEDALPKGGPRAIQYRGARAALEMARFTQSIEHQVYELNDDHGTRIFGKGCNQHTLAEDFLKKRDLFRDPAFLMLDASKFDAHVSVEFLEIVRCFYVQLLQLAGQAKYVSYLWGKTLTSYGYTRHGIKYKTRGTRMSGDMDTGLGNSLIMFAALTHYMYVTGISKYVMAINGDDSVIFIEKDQLAKARDISCFVEMGLKMKFEVALDFQHMEFCQCRMVETDYGWTLARSPHRIITRLGWSVNKFGKSRLKDYILSLGMGECAVSYGVPIGYAIGLALKLAGRGGKYTVWDRWAQEWCQQERYWEAEVGTVSYATRVSYERAFDISPEKQIELENSIKVRLGCAITDQQWHHFRELFPEEPLMGL